MASSKQDVQLILKGLVSMASRGLQQIDLQKNFDVIRELGDGGYGSVLMVKDKKRDQVVALKLLDKKKTTEFSFLIEFSIAFFLSSHPNIVGVYGSAFKTNDYLAYTQELSTNGDLFSLIPLPEDTVKRCAVQISSALEFMDGKGLVHMDIKPENILVFDKDCHCIKITDFGLSRIKGTVTNQMLGTRSYMAPEMRQVTDEDSLLIDSSLDVWSFGILLYLLLTGEFPWESAVPTDKAYCNFVEWQYTFGNVKPPLPWTRLPPGILEMFAGLLDIDWNRRSKCTDILIYLDECWKKDLTQSTDTDTAEINLSEESGPTSVSHTIVSTTSILSAQSYDMTSNSAEDEEHPHLWEDNTQYPPMFIDDKISVYVGAEVEIG